MVPDIEEVRGEAEFLAFADLEILDQRSIPVLLERTVVEIAAKISETSGAVVRIGETLSGI